jgi:hypothetical protein
MTISQPVGVEIRRRTRIKCVIKKNQRIKRDDFDVKRDLLKKRFLKRKIEKLRDYEN